MAEPVRVPDCKCIVCPRRPRVTKVQRLGLLCNNCLGVICCETCYNQHAPHCITACEDSDRERNYDLLIFKLRQYHRLLAAAGRDDALDIPEVVLGIPPRHVLPLLATPRLHIIVSMQASMAAIAACPVVSLLVGYGDDCSVQVRPMQRQSR
jgi:hypothetical protein